MPGPNPAGLAALKEHRHKTYFGSGRHKQCEALCRRNGKPCRSAAMKGRTKCRLHGGHSTGRGIKKPLAGRSEGQQRNHRGRQVRLASQSELERTELHPETLPTFRQLQLGRKLIYQADIPVLMLTLDKYLKGKCDRREWLRVLEGSCE